MARTRSDAGATNGAAPAAAAAAATPAATDPVSADSAATPADAPPAKRPRTEGISVPAGICAFNHVEDWFEFHKGEFEPPVCNRLMHKGQLSIMFVGGPNTREDFHLEEGSEFFWQMRGNIELPTLQKGKRKVVSIKQGQVFCLPSRIPHSPQRPMPGSFGLVVERQRAPSEMDGLIFYSDFQKCDEVKWERFFRCDDLRKDLPPVIQAYREFEASEASKKPRDWLDKDRPIRQNMVTEVPSPFFMDDFLLANADKLAAGEAVPLLGRDHPDKEMQVFVVGGPSQQHGQLSKLETWLYQIKGTAHISVQGGTLALTEGCCCIVQSGVGYDVSRSEDSVGLVLRQDPAGNKSLGRDAEDATAGDGAATAGAADGPTGAGGAGGLGASFAASLPSLPATVPDTAGSSDEDESEEEDDEADE